MSRFNRELQLTLQAAMREAVRRRHAYLTVEHLLFALCHDERGAEVLRHSGANVRKLKSELAQFLDAEIAAEPGEEPIDTGQTLAFHRVIQSALAHAQNAESEEVDAGDLVAAIFQEPDSQALALLRTQGVSRLDVLKYVSHGISKLPESRSGAEANGGSPPAAREFRRRRGRDRRSARRLLDQPDRARERGKARPARRAARRSSSA